MISGIYMNSVEIKMSERLITIADMLSRAGKYLPEYEGKQLRTAYVGCDHGYISIYLAEKDISSSCIAMDVRKGPLSGALANIREHGLEERIATRLSDGLKELKKGEADSVVIAGMGGDLMKRIITDADVAELGIKIGVLQPQSELCEFRAFLRESGFYIAEEKIVYEDGKYYFPMLVIFSGDRSISDDHKKTNSEGACCSSFLDKTVERLCDNGGVTKEDALNICNAYGEHNILSSDPLLKKYLLHGKKVSESIVKNLDGDTHAGRLAELNRELFYIDTILKVAF